MSDTALIIRDDAQMRVSMGSKFSELKASALEECALIGKVNDIVTNSACAAAMVTIQGLLKLAEAARKEAKEPSLEFGRRIDATVANAVQDLKTEQMRLAKLAGDFAQEQLARQRAAEQAENQRLSALERDRLARLAAAETVTQVEQINEQSAALARDTAPVPPPPIRATGQTITEDWNIIVTDIWMLAKAHPTCVRIEPLNGEIKSLLKAGVKVAGVHAEKVVKVSARSTRVGAINV